MYGYGSAACPNCNTMFPFRDEWGPLTYVEREADDHGPRVLVVIGGDRLLHSCPLDGEP